MPIKAFAHTSKIDAYALEIKAPWKDSMNTKQQQQQAQMPAEHGNNQRSERQEHPR